jgi:hypothetical protein
MTPTRITMTSAAPPPTQNVLPTDTVHVPDDYDFIEKQGNRQHGAVLFGCECTQGRQATGTEPDDPSSPGRGGPALRYAYRLTMVNMPAMEAIRWTI